MEELMRKELMNFNKSFDERKYHGDHISPINNA